MAAGDLWVDYSDARPSMAELKSWNITGVFRYLSALNSSTQSKVITPGEYNTLVANDFDIILNYEWYTGRMLEGSAAGLQDGQIALAQAKGVGYPQGCIIVFSHDTGELAYSAISAYLDGVAAAFGGYYRIGIYSGIDVVDTMITLGKVVFGWQTRAWSNGRVSSVAKMFQRNGDAAPGGCDLDVVLRTPLFSRKEVNPVDGGFLMALTDAQQTETWQNSRDAVHLGQVNGTNINGLVNTCTYLNSAAHVMDTWKNQQTVWTRNTDTSVQALQDAAAASAVQVKALLDQATSQAAKISALNDEITSLQTAILGQGLKIDLGDVKATVTQSIVDATSTAVPAALAATKGTMSFQQQ